jgi:hypothetical protein
MADREYGMGKGNAPFFTSTPTVEGAPMGKGTFMSMFPAKSPMLPVKRPSMKGPMGAMVGTQSPFKKGGK